MVANLSSFYVELLTAVDSHIPTRPDLARGTKGTKRGAPYYVMQDISAKGPKVLQLSRLYMVPYKRYDVCKEAFGMSVDQSFLISDVTCSAEVRHVRLRS